MQAVFRAIAEPTRREILGLLAAKEMTIGEVAGHFDSTRPAVAKHLKILKESGLIRVETRGRERINTLNAAPLKDVADWLAFFDRYWDQKLGKLKQALEAEDDGDN